MSACTTHATRAAARVAAAVVIGIAVAAAAAAPSQALGLPDPAASLTQPLAPVTDAVAPLTKPLTSAPAPAQPAAPRPGGGSALPGVPGSGGSSGGTSSSPASSQSAPSASARVGGDDAVAADAEIDGLLGLCVRIPRDGSKPKADISVLDRDLIATLTMAGVPVRDIVVPCPAGLGGPATGSTGSGAGSTTTQAARASAVDPAADPGTGRLAFTGAEVVPTAVLAFGLLWLGALLTLASRRAGAAARLAARRLPAEAVAGA